MQREPGRGQEDLSPAADLLGALTLASRAHPTGFDLATSYGKVLVAPAARYRVLQFQRIARSFKIAVAGHIK